MASTQFVKPSHSRSLASSKFKLFDFTLEERAIPAVNLIGLFQFFGLECFGILGKISFLYVLNFGLL
ncbi:unnamed protein product [Rhizophagus irregularis]|nr:unnamed protein product [Rhizophagus irregularis]